MNFKSFFLFFTLLLLPYLCQCQLKVQWSEGDLYLPEFATTSNMWGLEDYEQLLESGLRVREFDVYQGDTIETGGFVVVPFNDSLFAVTRTVRGKERGRKTLMGKHPTEGYYTKHNRFTKKKIEYKADPNLVEYQITSDSVGYTVEMKDYEIIDGDSCMVMASAYKYTLDNLWISRYRASRPSYADCLDSNWRDSPFLSSTVYTYISKTEYIVEQSSTHSKTHHKHKVVLEYENGKPKRSTIKDMLNGSAQTTYYSFKNDHLYRTEHYYNRELRSILILETL